MNYIRVENHRKLEELNGDLLFYAGIIWYCFTGAFGIDLYRWNWLGIKSVVPAIEIKTLNAKIFTGFIPPFLEIFRSKLFPGFHPRPSRRMAEKIEIWIYRSRIAF
jgi:hypothetical protein